jgi:hypothetical protein
MNPLVLGYISQSDVIAVRISNPGPWFSWFLQFHIIIDGASTRFGVLLLPYGFGKISGTLSIYMYITHYYPPANTHGKQTSNELTMCKTTFLKFI